MAGSLHNVPLGIIEALSNQEGQVQSEMWTTLHNWGFPESNDDEADIIEEAEHWIDQTIYQNGQKVQFVTYWS